MRRPPVEFAGAEHRVARRTQTSAGGIGGRLRAAKAQRHGRAPLTVEPGNGAAGVVALFIVQFELVGIRHVDGFFQLLDCPWTVPQGRLCVSLIENHGGRSLAGGLRCTKILQGEGGLTAHLAHITALDQQVGIVWRHCQLARQALLGFGRLRGSARGQRRSQQALVIGIVGVLLDGQSRLFDRFLIILTPIRRVGFSRRALRAGH